MPDIFDIAEFFVQITAQSGDPITNLKLNQLLYYSQGAYLARTGKPLFHDPVETYSFSPVIPAIYQKYSVYGRNSISACKEDMNCSQFTEDELEVLLDVIREIGQYTDAELVALTHQQNTPWSRAIAKNTKELSLSDIKEYFRDNPVQRFQQRITVPSVRILPADWYNPEEDAEWEAYL